MKPFIAAIIAIGVLWLVDNEFNDGRYGDVVARGIFSLIGR